MIVVHIKIQVLIKENFGANYSPIITFCGHAGLDNFEVRFDLTQLNEYVDLIPHRIQMEIKLKQKPNECKELHIELDVLKNKQIPQMNNYWN